MVGFHQGPLFFNEKWNVWNVLERKNFLLSVPKLEVDGKELEKFSKCIWDSLPLLIKDLVDDRNHQEYLDEIEEDYWEEYSESFTEASEAVEELGSCYDEDDYLYWQPEPMKSD